LAVIVLSSHSFGTEGGFQTPTAVERLLHELLEAGEGMPAEGRLNRAFGSIDSDFLNLRRLSP
jgi:hypothetical protein